ncbi:MAG: PDR/VanB family oxidoreductase [Rubrivivax sp.]
MSQGCSEWLDLVVLNARQETHNVTVLDLGCSGGEPMPDWEPGAHIDVRSTDREGAEVTRQYSLCGPRRPELWRIAVLAEAHGRGGSVHLFHTARTGSRLAVRGPRNHFRLPQDAAPVLLVAGGIGITPLLSMAESLHAQGRDFRLHCFARSRSSMAFREHLLGSDYRERVHLSFDDEPTGRISEIFRDADTDAWLYTCGPQGFMQAVTEAAAEAGIGPDRVRQELFSPPAQADEASLQGANRPFTLDLRSSGQRIDVPADQTAVRALADAGVEVVVSCEQGYCGSCLTRVLEGVPDHRDEFMLPEERERNDAFTPCCSRAKTLTLVLDL